MDNEFVFVLLNHNLCQTENSNTLVSLSCCVLKTVYSFSTIWPYMFFYFVCVCFFQILALFPFDDLQISGRAVISGRHEVLSWIAGWKQNKKRQFSILCGASAELERLSEVVTGFELSLNSAFVYFILKSSVIYASHSSCFFFFPSQTEWFCLIQHWPKNK